MSAQIQLAFSALPPRRACVFASACAEMSRTAKDHEASVALATVFLLNAVALVVFPPIGHGLHLNGNQVGLWAAPERESRADLRSAGAEARSRRASAPRPRPSSTASSTSRRARGWSRSTARAGTSAASSASAATPARRRRCLAARPCSSPTSTDGCRPSHLRLQTRLREAVMKPTRLLPGGDLLLAEAGVVDGSGLDGARDQRRRCHREEAPPRLQAARMVPAAGPRSASTRDARAPTQAARRRRAMA